jgi:hypothetical protein
MLSLGMRIGRISLIVISTFNCLDHVSSAPGDVRLDILTVTGDAAAGPGGNVISSFETSPSIDVAPVAIDDNGFISFAANVQVGGDLEYGFYQSRSLGEIATILQTDGLAPGLSTVDLSKPGGFRNLELNPPGRGVRHQQGRHQACVCGLYKV